MNLLPYQLWQLRQASQRARILRAYALLKVHGIEVNLDLNKIPKAAKIGKWTSKAAKILADQLLFASTYTFVFFMGIGIMTGALEKYESDLKLQRYQHEKHRLYLLQKLQKVKENKAVATTTTKQTSRPFNNNTTNNDEITIDSTTTSSGTTSNSKLHFQYSNQQQQKQNSNTNTSSSSAAAIIRLPEVEDSAVETELDHVVDPRHFKTYSSIIDDDDEDYDIDEKSDSSTSTSTSTSTSLIIIDGSKTNSWYDYINNYLYPQPIPTLQQPITTLIKPKTITWQEIWNKSWENTKAVYWETYMADCLVWPPIQLINFTFVPVKLQFLYVNTANLAWNTYLSLMANGHGQGGQGGHSTGEQGGRSNETSTSSSTSSSSSQNNKNEMNITLISKIKKNNDNNTAATTTVHTTPTAVISPKVTKPVDKQ